MGAMPVGLQELERQEGRMDWAMALEMRHIFHVCFDFLGSQQLDFACEIPQEFCSPHPCDLRRIGQRHRSFSALRRRQGFSLLPAPGRRVLHLSTSTHATLEVDRIDGLVSWTEIELIE
ncbi:hypothetical protein N657DRAFT_642412 [Parathielavia appendiculata]|uniref:Uncharacterized protein n=1 Tax=Parathielavia appendiculata TaxID=2587402 RepID=A0AAN6Z5T9_9PEZI|nr:hypothetical protein N657DRAFT_642412 [Parathielavia appendiculata]